MDNNSDRTTVPDARVTTGLEGVVHRLISRQVAVLSNECVGSSYRLLSVGGESLRNRNWTPGDILQVAFGGWESRAYTPFAFDRKQGNAQFLGYVHGNGIGSAWLGAVEVTEQRYVLGPRAAVNLSALRRPTFFFGDETSLSTAAAFHATPQGLRDVQFVFEVGSVRDARVALERLQILDGVTLLQRHPHEPHFERLKDLARSAFQANPASHAVLTGAALSISQLYKTLRGLGVPSKQVTNLAYWAPGRKGFSGVQR